MALGVILLTHSKHSTGFCEKEDVSLQRQRTVIVLSVRPGSGYLPALFTYSSGHVIFNHYNLTLTFVIAYSSHVLFISYHHSLIDNKSHARSVRI